MPEKMLLFSTNTPQESLFQRLLHEFAEASREFRQNPKAYCASAISGAGPGGQRRKILLEYGLAISLLLYSSLFLMMLILQTIRANRPDGDQNYSILFTHLPPTARPPDAPEPEGDKDQASSGGGGGGHNQNEPATNGQPPPFSPEPPIIAPTTKPALKPPDLPVRETLLGDQNLKRDDLQPTGLPDAATGPPADGPGSNGGIGTGNKGGDGPGNGPGFGPGNNGRQNDGDNTPGSRRRPDSNEAVDSRPVPLNKPRPNYTETARQNKVQGVVRARILVGTDGAVKQVKLVGAGLPDGLNEEAIRAATQMRFQPATRNGQAVVHWVTVEIEFNIR